MSRRKSTVSIAASPIYAAARELSSARLMYADTIGMTPLHTDMNSITNSIHGRVSHTRRKT